MPAPLGNKNGQLPAGLSADSFLHVRCRTSDKTQWVRAANRAVKQGRIQADARGALAPWVIEQLNKAAEEQHISRPNRGR